MMQPNLDHQSSPPVPATPATPIPASLKPDPSSLGELSELVDSLVQEPGTERSASPVSGSAATEPAVPDAATSATTSTTKATETTPSVQAASPSTTELPENDRILALARLGVSNGLFVSLQAKHAPTASHCLRVALTCSAWAKHLNLSHATRDLLEVGALLHDVGKIGVPDAVLFKPTQLDRDDLAQLDRYRQHSLEILAASGAKRELIDTVFFASAWFDGSRKAYGRRGDQLPVTSRMLSIVDAFDSITTDQPHRRARSQDEAITELFSYAGTQFDPELTTRFERFLAQQPQTQHSLLANQWLQDLADRTDGGLWNHSSFVPRMTVGTEQLFHQQLVDTLRDAVVFVDAQARVTTWSGGAERMTGISGAGAQQKLWAPSLVQLRDEHGELIRDAECPIAEALRSGESRRLRGSVLGRGNRQLPVDMKIRPVIASNGVVHGAAIVLEDLSSEMTLAERLEALNARVAVDPLTKIANRAEIDRVHAELVVAAASNQNAFSMMICDIDFFKTINDDYGHPAGDEALMVFASLLKRFKRPGDLVGRYGGEEFVMLCADCDLVCVTERAESIRRTLETTRVAALDQKSMTASFGVTQLLPGDTADTMLRRADRALLKAKETGRNRVVQLGGQIDLAEELRTEAPPARGLWDWLRGAPQESPTETRLVTTVPIDLAVEKFRGFVSDHAAHVLRVQDNHVSIKVDGKGPHPQRRQSDRPVPLLVDLDFQDASQVSGEMPDSYRRGTLIRIQVQPIRHRDRRRKDVSEQTRTLVMNLKSYFMGVELGELAEPAVERAATESRRDPPAGNPPAYGKSAP